MPLSLDRDPYFIAYDSLYGYANVDHINAEGSGSEPVYSTTWTSGWTQIVPFDSGGDQFVLLYKGGIGEVEIDEISVGGDDGRPARPGGRRTARGRAKAAPRVTLRCRNYGRSRVQAPKPCVATYITRFFWSMSRFGMVVVGRPGCASVQPVCGFCCLTMPKSVPA